jgi:hypothetical protein
VKKKANASRVMFILGAGASVPLGMPTTVSLRKMLCDDTPEGRAAAEIHRSAAYRFRVSRDDINIEDFLEHLYELQFMLWLARRSELPQLLPGFTANESVPAAADDLLKALHRRVYQLLHDQCGDCSGKKVDALWRPILKSLSSRQAVIPIFTLNYDWTFEKLASERMNQYHLIDGFETLGGSWDAGRFSNIKPASGKTNITLFKLHGSTCWLPGGPIKSLGSFGPEADYGDGGYPPHRFEMVYPGHSHERWFGDEYSSRLNESSGVLEPWAEREPYKTLHGHLRESLHGAGLIVVIGYAFQDRLVNAELAAALETNERAGVLVVDPGIRRYVKSLDATHQDPPFEFLKLGELEFPWSRFTWLEGKFGDKRVSAKLIREFSAFLS